MPRSSMPCLLARTLVPLAGLGGALAAQGAVHIVDDDGGAGVAFTEIQPAVDAAAPGDVIIVRAGSYDGFKVLGKPLEILGEGKDQVTVGLDPATLPVRIEGTPAGNGTALSGLRILGFGTAPLEVRNNHGRVSLSGLHVGAAPDFGHETACAVLASSDLVSSSPRPSTVTASAASTPRPLRSRPSTPRCGSWTRPSREAGEGARAGASRRGRPVRRACRWRA